MALDKELLMDPAYTEPLYDTFMRGLPHLYNDQTDVEQGYAIEVRLSGMLNKSWFLTRQTETWALTANRPEHINTSVELADDIAWVIFTNTDREKEKYRLQITITGDERIGLRLLDFVTVMS